MTERVALVTGGGSGIGREICVGLAAAGRNVAVADLNLDGALETASLISATGGTAIAVHMDVADSDAVQGGILQVLDELGPPEILVNCAGWDELMPFLSTDEDFWDRVIEINYKGVLRTVHACLPSMTENGWGRIVNIASDAGRVGSSFEAVYSGAKGGVIGFTKTIAREAARSGVTANVVCPGPTDTPLLDGIVAASDDGDKIIGAMARAVPMKRVGTPIEVASAVLYFCSEEAAFVTGQTLSVSGGLTMS
ncbi:MAG: 2-hydroxycyclohexanecarboxyl-CoA dehydrogenase [Acidimicrobiaceae bacterium]|nr:2-hydroxycyclohexanecarboxyl-CoA dehydrogenase [Acidimicrobiaceae bacterium]HAQ42639.1 2-hydroxycyclohexanecarboxyl-CoA dehydrogenase [Acidimicrobiaceae bacterium]|tara:strand:- start:2997 stop:3752 length:756 start_codon:yes stop_codon:yes gene_type:complete